VVPPGGAGQTTTCNVTSAGSTTATVEVTDGRGAETRASATVQGNASLNAGSEDRPGTIDSVNCTQFTITTCSYNSGSSKCYDRVTITAHDAFSSTSCSFTVNGTYR